MKNRARRRTSRLGRTPCWHNRNTSSPEPQCPPLNPIRPYLSRSTTPAPNESVRRSSRTDIKRNGEHEQLPESDEGDPGGEEKESGGTISGNEGWLLTSAVCQEPADPMCHIGLARGRSAPPSNPLLAAAQPGLRAGGAAPRPPRRCTDG